MSAKLLDTFEGRLRLHGALVTGTALHIGAGGSGDALGTDSPVVRTAGGKPYIPGSSLKGVLRSAAEALLRGGPFQEGQKGYWACDILGEKESVCVSHEEVEEFRKNLAGRAVAEAVWAESCAVCKLFGSLALASRVRFADLPVLGEVPLAEFRNGVGIDRDKELAANGVLYDFEVVPPETSFELRVTVDNPTDEEVGLLLYLFNELNDGNLTLGGKSSRGLGRVRVVWDEIEEISLKQTNPFVDLLSSRNLLAPAGPAATAAPVAADPLEGKLPTTGDPAAWRALAEILLNLPKIDKGLLAEQAAKISINKDNLNERLDLGLTGRKAKKPWDFVFDRFVASGLLIQEGQNYLLAGQEVESTAESMPPGRPPELQVVFDHYIGAMAKVWEAH